MSSALRPAPLASLPGIAALLVLAVSTVHCASDDDLDLMGPSTGAGGVAGSSAGASAAGGQTGGTAGGLATGGQGGTAAGSGAGASGSGTAGAGIAGFGGQGEGGGSQGGQGGTTSGGTDGGTDGGAAGEGGSTDAGGASQGGAGQAGQTGTGGSGPSNCCVSNADCPTLPFQQICAEGVCLGPPIGIPVANSCWADSECSTQRPKCVAESVCGCGEAGCSSSKDKRGTCVQGSCCAADDDCEGAQNCRKPDGQGGFGRCSPPAGDAGCYVNADCKGQQKCTGQKTCACGDAGCAPKPGKCGN